MPATSRKGIPFVSDHPHLAPETYELFDDIILLSEGQIVYQGPRDNILEFFLKVWDSNALTEKKLGTFFSRLLQGKTKSTTGSRRMNRTTIFVLNCFVLVFKAIKNLICHLETFISRMNQLISSTEDSPEQLGHLKQLNLSILDDRRLDDHLNSQVLSLLVKFLDDKKGFKFQRYSPMVLKHTAYSKSGSEFKDISVPYLVNLISSPNLSVQMQEFFPAWCSGSQQDKYI